MVPLPKLPYKLWLVAATIDSCLFSLLAMYCTEQWLTDRVPVIGSFAGLQLSFNEGVAFGIHLGPWQDIVIMTALLVVAVVAVKTASSVLEEIGFGFILGGGLSNIIDRLLDGVVTDMIQVGSFPIFNVADTFINIGIGLLLIQVIFLQKKIRHGSIVTP